LNGAVNIRCIEGEANGVRHGLRLLANARLT
jgi:hypothetical protein